jgi:restriction system protein
MPTPGDRPRVGAAITLVALAALVDAVRRAHRLRRQRALSDLAALSWQQFGEVIADAFRRHGYRVREVGGRGRTDGGVDLVLIRGGETTVVQAKHWRSQRVSVQPVRELYGVQRAMQVERSMFVAMGRYTADAARFAADVGMTLVDGDALLAIISAGLEARAWHCRRRTVLLHPPAQHAVGRWCCARRAGAPGPVRISSDAPRFPAGH